MDTQGEHSHRELAQQLLDAPSPFLRALTTVADRRDVVASDDIFARGGIKLVSRGTALSGSFYERLTAHKLLKPIEQTVSIADAPDAARIIALAHAAAGQIPSLQPLLGSTMLARLGDLLGDAVIPPELALKLVVMQEERPRLFRHSLVAAAVSMVLGIRGQLPSRELQALALASICHDIGELYIDPDFFCPERRMSAEERRHLYVHPVTGYLMLRNFPELPEGTAQAVLQHHERLDGAGYPYRLRGDEISRLGRFLAVAEVSASLIENQGADRRIGIKFRMNANKYDREAVTLISGLFDVIEPQATDAVEAQRLGQRLARLSALFASWQRFYDACTAEQRAAIAPVVDRIVGLRLMVLEPGFDQFHLEDILDLAGESDAEVALELAVLVDELTWHFDALLNAIERERRVWGMEIPGPIRTALDAWLQEVRAFVSDDIPLSGGR